MCWAWFSTAFHLVSSFTQVQRRSEKLSFWWCHLHFFCTGLNNNIRQTSVETQIQSDFADMLGYLKKQLISSYCQGTGLHSLSVWWLSEIFSGISLFCEFCSTSECKICHTGIKYGYSGPANALCKETEKGKPNLTMHLANYAMLVAKFLPDST